MIDNHDDLYRRKRIGCPSPADEFAVVIRLADEETISFATGPLCSIENGLFLSSESRGSNNV